MYGRSCFVRFRLASQYANVYGFRDVQTILVCSFLELYAALDFVTEWKGCRWGAGDGGGGGVEGYYCGDSCLITRN